MPVLTRVEMRMVTGAIDLRTPSTEEQVKEIEKKLATFQGSITNISHINAVNSHIAPASAVADRKAKNRGEWIKKFLCEMDRRTCEAGLRFRVADIPLYKKPGEKTVNGIGAWEAEQLKN
jgi:hypothetical protein